MQSEPTFELSTELVVYTTIMGGNYDLPLVTATSAVSYVCFTDKQYFKANGWQIIEIDPILASDLPRSSRAPKICPHRFIHGVDKSIYIDPSVELLDDPLNIWNQVMDDETVFGGFYHSFRETLLDEFIAVFDQQLDGAEVLAEQFNTYSHLGAQELTQKPVWGGFLLRRHNDPACRVVMEQWLAHVLRYSRRDQLSLPIVLSALDNSRKQIVDLDAYSSEFHRWPRAGYERPANYKQSGEPKLFPPAFELRQAEAQIKSTENEIRHLKHTVRELDNLRNESLSLIEELKGELAVRSRDLQASRDIADDLRNRIHRKNKRIENLLSQLSGLRESRSYRFANSLVKSFTFGRHKRK